MSDNKVNNNQLGKAFTPACCLDRDRFVHNSDSQKVLWDISFHQHISNFYKDGQYDTFTSCYYRDCFTVMMKLVSLPLICIQSETEIITDSHPDPPQLLNFMHTTIVYD